MRKTKNPAKKWEDDTSIPLFKEDTQVANKHMKKNVPRCSLLEECKSKLQ